MARSRQPAPDAASSARRGCRAWTMRPRRALPAAEPPSFGAVQAQFRAQLLSESIQALGGLPAIQSFTAWPKAFNTPLS